MMSDHVDSHCSVEVKTFSRTNPKVAAWALAAAVFAVLLLGSSPAHAYIDPGTGSALVYVVVAVVVSLYFAVRGLYYRVVDLFFRSRLRIRKCTLAVHSEDPRYETTFVPVLRELAARGVEATYFTMYERGEAFAPLPDGVEHAPVPPGLVILSSGVVSSGSTAAGLVVLRSSTAWRRRFGASKSVRRLALGRALVPP